MKDRTHKEVYISATDGANYFDKKRDEHIKNLNSEMLFKNVKISPVKDKSNGCFISKNRICTVEELETGLVFIAGSGDEEFEKDVKKIIDVLKEKGHSKPYSALLEEKFNEDAFCSKICSKILSSEFCIVLLNSPIHIAAKDKNLDIRTPSANVYFEYGMMCALNKKIIPVLRKYQRLPFNVQHLDVLMYSNIDELYEKLKNVV